MPTPHPPHPPAPRTVGQLKASGYRPLSVKDELRKNVIAKLRKGEELFPGILGYRETVIPQIINAILSKHDMLFLGLRGQAKTRILRMLPELLDEYIPTLAGAEISDDPLAPTTTTGKRILAEQGDEAGVEWVHRSTRYHEKLATPDVTIADLIGEIDLVKHAQGRYLSDESTMHFGLIPRTNRGIFAINELPDLAPKIQVGLFNVLEERDIQIRGYPIRLNLDVCMVFSANPEDYTNRGRIVTPLKDRIGSVIRTHYPASILEGIDIVRQNAWKCMCRRMCMRFWRTLCGWRGRVRISISRRACRCGARSRMPRMWCRRRSDGGFWRRRNGWSRGWMIWRLFRRVRVASWS